MERRKAVRGGFTLIEMMVAIVIIAILMALLIPALAGARRRANIAKVTVEIKQFDMAIVGFKTRFGVEPPSRITLYTTQAGWNGDASARATITRIWPQFNFTMTNGAGENQGYTYPTSWGAPGSTVNLNAGECLLFFLGGLIENGAPTGFAKNPAFPFSPQFQPAPNPQMTTRDSPFMEFDKSRFRDTDGNGAMEYLDPLPDQTKPYLYFSGYEGRGYRVTGATSELPTGGTLLDVYRVNGAEVSPVGPLTQVLPAWKAQSYQIISPGTDGDYGTGGVYNADLNVNRVAGLQSIKDHDNITNFSSGQLVP